MKPLTKERKLNIFWIKRKGWIPVLDNVKTAMAAITKNNNPRTNLFLLILGFLVIFV